jgi:hypothetical protein
VRDGTGRLPLPAFDTSYPFAGSEPRQAGRPSGRRKSPGPSDTFRCCTPVPCEVLMVRAVLCCVPRQAEPPREWLQRLEDVLALRLPDCSALQLLTLLVSLSQLKRLGLDAMEAASAAGLEAATTPSGTTGAAATAGIAEMHQHAPAADTPGVEAAAAIRSPDNTSGVSGGIANAAEPNTNTSSSTSSPGDGRPRGRQVRRAARASEASRSEASSSGAGAVGSDSLPSRRWLSCWWSASGALLRRVRYAPSELLLTASWLLSLELRPPLEWLEVGWGQVGIWVRS